MAQYSSYPYIVNKDRPKAEALQRCSRAARKPGGERGIIIIT